jgi:hypothetical protein
MKQCLDIPKRTPAGDQGQRYGGDAKNERAPLMHQIRAEGIDL